MKWCCAAFEGWHQEAGKRGISVFVDEARYGEPMFVLQARAMDWNVQISELAESNSQLQIAAVSEIVIQYCPWCGQNLMKWYKKDLPQLIKPGLRIHLRWNRDTDG